MMEKHSYGAGRVCERTAFVGTPCRVAEGAESILTTTGIIASLEVEVFASGATGRRTLYGFASCGHTERPAHVPSRTSIESTGRPEVAWHWQLRSLATSMSQ